MSSPRLWGIWCGVRRVGHRRGRCRKFPCCVCIVHACRPLSPRRPEETAVTMADIDVVRTAPDPVPPSSVRASGAHTFFWAVLITAAAVSVTGNAAQAVLHDTQLPAVAAVVAIIPPLALLAAVHGVSVLSRAHAHARGTYLL